MFHFLVYHQNICHFFTESRTKTTATATKRRANFTGTSFSTSRPGLPFGTSFLGSCFADSAILKAQPTNNILYHLSIFCSNFFFSIHGQCLFEAGLINQVHVQDLHCHPVASPEGAIRYSIMVAVLQTEQSRRQNSQQIEAAASCNHPYHMFSKPWNLTQR